MRGPLSYIGGKNRLAKKIISLFPEHATYVEPFAGGAQVFFHKNPSKVEVLNDLDGEIVNFFRVCQWHHEELIRYLRFCLVSRKWHELLKNTDPKSLTDVQRAGRFFYLQKNCFGGLVVKQNYHYGVTHRPNYNPQLVPELIEKTHRRLMGVQIESQAYELILKRYDRPTTLFYLDPPYWGRKLYNHNFSDEDFRELEKRLHSIKGKFILSLNDLPEVRQTFNSFRMESISIAYTAQLNPGNRYGELFIMNFDPAIQPKSTSETPESRKKH
jgi:DNA adenine methylase